MATPLTGSFRSPNRTSGSRSVTSRPGSPRSGGLRRPPEKGLPRLRHKVQQGWERGLELWWLWTLLFFIVALWALLPRRLFDVPRVAAGTVADRTWIADRDISVANESATREIREKVTADVPPVYDFSRGAQSDLHRRLTDLFATGRAHLAATAAASAAAERGESLPVTASQPPSGKAPEPLLTPLPPDLHQLLVDASGLELTREQVEWLRDRSFAPHLEEPLRDVAVRVLRRGVVSNKALLLGHRATGITLQELPTGRRQVQLDLYRYLDYPDGVRQAMEEDLRTWDDLSGSDRQMMTDLLLANLEPNLTLNSSATLELRNEAAEDVGTVSHSRRKGEVIVRKGERVSELDARILAEMAPSRDSGALLLAGLGTFLLLTAAVVLIWGVAGHERRPDRSRIRLLNECLLLLGVHLVATRFAFFVAGAIAGAIAGESWSSIASYTYAVPFAALAMTAVLLYGQRLAFFLALVFSLLAGHIVGGEAIWSTSLYSLMGSLAAIFVLEHHRFEQRAVMIRAGVLVGGVHVLGVVILRSLSGEIGAGLPQLGLDVLCALAGGLLAAGVTSFSVPMFEGLLAITTHIKLLELSNTNLPLLRRLALEARGTFQHSLAVANLAKAGCEAIGVDPVLAHTVALYHDIGKIHRPRYFVENQMGGPNPHDKIQPSMSALILINHVKDGRELALKHRLPQPIIDAIEQHHGTQLIKFFHQRAQERCAPDTEEIREDDFRYPGPKPQSKEMGVLMLADGVEAASRTLVEPSRQKIRALLRKLFDACLRDRQLDHTDLTLGDLRRVEDAFLDVLTNIYHSRVDYPGFDFNRPGKHGPGKEGASRDTTSKNGASKNGASKEGRPGDPSGKIQVGKSGLGEEGSAPTEAIPS